MNKARVLLADDHAVVREGIRKALDEIPNLEVLGEVGDGPGLMQALEELQPNCLLIDVTMPDFEPIASIKRIRVLYPKLYILVVSAYDDDIYVQGLLSAGVNGYHLKDQSLNDLRLAVVRVLSGERWVSSRLLDKLINPQRSLTNLPKLSSRQQEILRLLVDGYDNRAIALELNLSIKTIENHLTRLYRQLDVSNRLSAARYVRDNPELLARTGQKMADELTKIDTSTAKETTILVVDDNKRYRGQICRLLNRVHPQAVVYEASNTADALKIARQVSPWIVLVDVVLADEDGINCARRLKSMLSSSRIILISAYPDREFHRRGLQAGATAFLDKKVLNADTLRQIVEDAVM